MYRSCWCVYEVLKEKESGSRRISPQAKKSQTSCATGSRNGSENRARLGPWKVELDGHNPGSKNCDGTIGNADN